ncbi:hypothetical protein Mgra_00009097 [Meloidogyne graminicola]|uniref:ADP-ribosylation factor-like protein 6 n=1 Tax=Meloidogyne graminicola TaxID=189291 RepID=A0A8S9ZDV7_9BILA|nr:hypothetical protein Mgra_00009097 [Meloidogyne graminicola]
MNLNDTGGDCGNLGDMMWRTASMYIIGKLLSRTVYYENLHKCFSEYKKEFGYIFKNGNKLIKLMNVKGKYIKLIYFGGEWCCFYDPIYRLEGENAQIIQLSDKIAKEIFRNYTPEYRLCVHTHRDDYIEIGQASTLNFVEGSIKYAMKWLKSNKITNIAIVLFGTDKNFLYEVEGEEGHIIYMPLINNNSINLYFGLKYCNSLIITASCSPIAWWMGYLIQKKKFSNIYYNNCNGYCKCNGRNVLDYFPNNWLPLHYSDDEQIDILVIGLDNSGKTTILNQLKPSETQSTNITPTVGYNIEKFSSSGMTFSAYDMSGQSRYRNLWETQYKNIHGIIFVVDASDRLRIAVARDELWMLLDHKDLTYKKTPLLIFANKSDVRDSVPASEIHLNLGLDLIRNRNWHIVSTCALTGQGLDGGIDWLANNIKQLLSHNNN